MGAHIMIRDINRWTPLHHSAFGGCALSTRALLDHHSTQPMKAKDEDGNTPLHIAAECGHVNIVKMMLSRGCLLYTSPSPRDRTRSRMPSSA